MTDAFAQLEQATSISDLRALVNNFDATAPWLDNYFRVDSVILCGKNIIGGK